MTTLSLPRLPGRHFWRWALLAGMLLVAAWAGVRVAGAKRHEQLVAVAAHAIEAVSRARAAEAAVWAPEDLLAAELALRTAQVALRVEQVRWWPVPDLGPLTASFTQVEAKAREATERAVARRLTAANLADALIDEANAAIEASADLAEQIHVGIERRMLLSRARTALVEARIYRREGDFSTALQRSRHAIELAAQVSSHATGVAARYADAVTVARWQRWRQDTIDWSRREGRAAIVVSKADHTLTLFVAGRLLKTYRTDMGFNWIADKQHAGDGATPEGRYRVTARKTNGASIYYKALLLDYPNAEDRARFSRARRAGDLPASASIGGLIEIHGEGGRGRDWTRGCVAVTNAEMDELFNHVQVGTPVTIIGSDAHGTIADVAARRRDTAGGR
ncbi:MAG: L,D-transpeptidase [Acidobacteriota bacterium]